MQPTGLRYFLAVARGGSITAAAERLNVAASAISRQIANLEFDLDCVLFERRPRGMVLSPAGELLAKHAQRVLAETDQVVTEIRELKGLTHGLIRLGSSEGFALGLLPRAIQAFRARYPGIRFELTIGPPAHVTRQVECGDVDLGLTFPVITTTTVDIIYQATVEMMIVASTKHPLANQDGISLQDMTHYPVAMTTHDTTLRLAFEAICLSESVSIVPAITANALAAIIPFVDDKRMLIPISTLSISRNSCGGPIVALPLLTRFDTGRQIQIQSMKNRQISNSCKVFLEVLLDLLIRSLVVGGNATKRIIR